MKARNGYTLLELILALAIGLLVVAALYFSLDGHHRLMQSGRDAVAEAQLANALLANMSADVRLSLAVLPQQPTSTTNSSTSSQTSSSSTTASSTQPSSSSTGSSSQDQSSSSGSSTTTDSTTQFNFSVVGDDGRLNLMISTSRSLARQDRYSQTGNSDLRRISYYLTPDGLAREEARPIVSNGNADSAPELLAAEVVDLQFRYLDNTTATWVTTWDGTVSGPPAAVEITLGIIRQRDLRQLGPARKQPVYYRMVVALPAAGPPPAQSSQNGLSQ